MRPMLGQRPWLPLTTTTARLAWGSATITTAATYGWGERGEVVWASSSACASGLKFNAYGTTHSSLLRWFTIGALIRENSCCPVCSCHSYPLYSGRAGSSLYKQIRTTCLHLFCSHTKRSCLTVACCIDVCTRPQPLATLTRVSSSSSQCNTQAQTPCHCKC